MESLDNLIIVPGHAAFHESVTTVPAHPEKDDGWVLQSFQHGEPPYFIEHMQRGLELLRQDESSLLLFSGGHTRKAAGHWSEAATYAAVAEHYGYWCEESVRHQLVGRVALEEYARDSFENILFSLYRFKELTGKEPEFTSVVGWRFKEARFDLHRVALGLAAVKFAYIGCNNPHNLEGAVKDELATLEQFRADPTGSHSVLAAKKEARDPFHHTPPYAEFALGA